MKNGTGKRIRVYLESLGEGVSSERLFRALSLILSEKDLMKHLSINQKRRYCSNFKECSKSEALAENLANS
jgi:hypothetical protein